MTKKALKSIVFVMLLSALSTPLFSDEANNLSSATVEYSSDPETLLISFHEVYPELANQDPTPLVRVFGDGRVVVFHPSYMKQAGQYEMVITRGELQDLLLELTPVLTEFDASHVKQQKQAANELLWAAATNPEDLTLYIDADAEISVFHLNIDSYKPNGLHAETISKQTIEKSWRGLRFDARDYPGLDSIQSLMKAQNTLKALTRRKELIRVGWAP